MRKNRRDNKAKYLLILLLLIAVGYAAIATTLKINGSAEIKSAKWDVYWENPQVLSGSVTETKPTLSESDTKATFDVTLNEPGDYYEFTIDAVNNGSLDAKIDTNGIVKQVKNASGEVVEPTILKYEVTNNDQEHTELQEGHILAKKSGNTPTKETYRVRVEYRNDEGINPSDLDDSNDLVFTIEFSVKYVQGPKVNNIQSGDPQLVNYTIDEMCPSCVFAGNTESAGFLNGDFILANSVNYKIDDYNDCGENFLGYILDDNVIKRAFACGRSEVGYFCIEGTTDGSKFERNIEILRHFYPDCDIDSSSSEITCGDAHIESNGYAEMNGYYHCMVSDSDDGIICH